MLHEITSSEIPWIIEFMQTHYPPAYEYLWEDGGKWYVENMYNATKLKEEFENEKAVFYQLIDKGNPVGYCKVIRDKNPPNYEGQRCFYIQRIYLATNCQGKGIGGRVMRQFIEGAKLAAYDFVWLESMEIGASRKFYERLGFETVDRIRLPYPGMVDETRGLLIMVLAIK